MRFIRVHSVWAGEGRGLLSLTLSVGSTFLLGLALQLLAIRQLPPGAYSTFVFALGIGNVAAAIAGAVQPVAAARALSGGSGGALPFDARSTTVIALGATLLAAGALSPQLGFVTAGLAVAQVPLHAAVAIGLGELQGRRAYGRMGIGYACFAVVRLGFVLFAMAAGNGGENAFVAALPAGLLATVGLVAALGGYPRASLRAGSDRANLAWSYGVWGVFAWLMNADAIAARLVLVGDEAGRYALAVTLGRQALYAILPLSFVLLPATKTGDHASQRGRFVAILGASASVFIGAVAVLGIAPTEVAHLVSGRDGSVTANVLRGYAVLGSLGALVTLQFTFLFALGRTPHLARLAVLTVATSALLLFTRSEMGLLTVQLIAVFALAAWLTWAGFSVTKPLLSGGAPEAPITPV